MIKKLIDFFILYIILRGIIAPFLTSLFKRFLLEPIANWFKHHFIRTEREMAIWLHYKNKALNKGHHHHHLEDCNDGMCKII